MERVLPSVPCNSQSWAGLGAWHRHWGGSGDCVRSRLIRADGYFSLASGRNPAGVQIRSKGTAFICSMSSGNIWAIRREGLESLGWKGRVVIKTALCCA